MECKNKSYRVGNTCELPKQLEYPSVFQAYGRDRASFQNPFYRTSSYEYGRLPPTVHSVTTSFFPKSQLFTRGLALSGMYRNYSLNTCKEKEIS